MKLIDEDIHKQIEDLLDSRNIIKNIYGCDMFDIKKCTTNRCSNCLADMIVDIIKKSGYVKLQAGDDGLISNDYICNHSIVCGGYSDREICEDSETCYGIEEHKISCKAQKALDDKYLEESCNILKEYYNKTVDQYTKEIEELSAENGKLQNRIKELDGLC